jgi:hypothetical protein
MLELPFVVGSRSAAPIRRMMAPPARKMPTTLSSLSAPHAAKADRGLNHFRSKNREQAHVDHGGKNPLWKGQCRRWMLRTHSWGSMMVAFLIAGIALVVAVIGCALVAPSDQGLEQCKTVIYPPRWPRKRPVPRGATLFVISAPRRLLPNPLQRAIFGGHGQPGRPQRVFRNEEAGSISAPQTGKKDMTMHEVMRSMHIYVAK